MVSRCIFMSQQQLGFDHHRRKTHLCGILLGSVTLDYWAACLTVGVDHQPGSLVTGKDQI